MNCRDCGLDKDPFEFPRDRKRKNGLSIYCKQCHVARNRAYRDRVKAGKVKRAAPSEKKCGRCSNTLPIASFGVDRNSADGRANVCKACRRTYHDQYDQTLEGRYRWLKNAARRRRKPFNLTFEEYTSILAAGRCEYCNGPLDTTGGGVDRKDNSQGYEAANLCACCGYCNTLKNRYLTYQEMMKLMESARKKSA
jgi:hypothetical protein